MEKLENDWTRQMDEIKVEIKKLQADNQKLKAENKQLYEEIQGLQRQREFWHDLATKGGGGNG
jgi:cell division protein FtsB